MPVSVLIPIKNEAANLPRCLRKCELGGRNLCGRFAEHGRIAATLRRSTARRSCSFSSTVSGRKRRTGRSRTSPFRTTGSSFSMPMKFCRRRRKRNLRTRSRNAGAIAGYWINRRFMFMGRWLRHAYYPNWNLRLFRHSLGRYEKLTDRRHGQWRQRSARTRDRERADRAIAVRAGSLRVSDGRSVRRKT